jgi:hypothetical protein
VLIALIARYFNLEGRRWSGLWNRLAFSSEAAVAATLKLAYGSWPCITEALTGLFKTALENIHETLVRSEEKIRSIDIQTDARNAYRRAKTTAVRRIGVLQTV